MLIIILFSIGFIYGLIMRKNNDPVARLTPEGIWVKDYGFIPWPEIIELSEYQFPGTPMVGIGIRVNDLKSLSKQASILGKLGVFYSKIFGYPPIIISSIALDIDQVICFARRFMPK